jgi:hypothetical protein
LTVSVGCPAGETRELEGALAAVAPRDAALALGVEPSGPPAAPADAALDRSGVSRIKSTVKGHMLFLPSRLSAPDGEVDLLIAFHAHQPLVQESAELAGLNAAVVVVNMGEGAGLYERVFSDPAAFATLLENVPAVLAARGLANPRLGRIAVVSWSAGYGAVQRILSQPENAARVDSALVLDGLHAHVFPDSDTIDPQEIDGYERFARRAIAGGAFFLVTHNHIVPEGGKIASVSRTSQLVLDRVGVARKKTDGIVRAPTLVANEGVYSSRRSFDLHAETIAQSGGLVVRAFAGRDPADHVGHLMCLVPLALEPLVTRWRSAATETGLAESSP